MIGCADTALVNQAPAMKLPGLGPSGFDPHACDRPGRYRDLPKEKGSHYRAQDATSTGRTTGKQYAPSNHAGKGRA